MGPKMNLPKRLNTGDKKNNFRSGMATYLLIFLFVMAIFLSLRPLETEQSDEVRLSEVFILVKEDNIEEIKVKGLEVTVTTIEGEELVSRIPENTSIYDLLQSAGVEEERIANLPVVVEEDIDVWGIVLSVGTILIPVLFILYLFKRISGGTGEIFSFGKSKARLFIKGKGKERVTFKDVAGADEAKQELSEVVDFLKSPDKYRKLGARIPKGVLLVGQPGVGKTLLARAVANEADVPFYSMAGSEFVEMLVGVGASRVRDLFETAKSNQPALIFIDEIESIGRQRGGGFMAGHDEKEQTLNQILVEMDGFDQRTSVIVLGATNRPELLDPALLRPGRFDRRIALQMPDVKEREEIIKLHMKGKPIGKDVSLSRLARNTVGFSGADIENMLNESAIMAARHGRKTITQDILEEAIAKVQIGPERKKILSDKEKQVLAYHEAGHAVVGIFMPHLDPIHRISIISRGQTLGHTLINPSEQINETMTRLLELISMILGGRAAERLVFQECTVGAHNDIEKATIIARKMVRELGMSNLGPLNFNLGGEADKNPFVRDISDSMAYKIDEEVKRIVSDRYEIAYKLLKRKRKTLDMLTEVLLKEETISDDKFIQVVKTAGEDGGIRWDEKYGDYNEDTKSKKTKKDN